MLLRPMLKFDAPYCLTHQDGKTHYAGGEIRRQRLLSEVPRRGRWPVFSMVPFAQLRERGFGGGYTAVKRAVQEIRPERERRFEVRFETPPGVQAQVDFARFVVEFGDDPGTSRIVWLFSLVLGHSRFIFARYVLHQDRGESHT